MIKIIKIHHSLIIGFNMEEDTKLLKTRIAVLESQLDLMLAERDHLNRMLITCGFMEGIPTLMKTVEEVLSSGELQEFDGENYIASSDN